ncbi:hypothetical protein RV06_GL001308 [Enterococcus haemoperoxidus]|nr:hypothetical protein RV06_GL001308 [Enterococcus haemoperoxidus]
MSNGSDYQKYTAKTLFSSRENRVELSYLKNANSNKPYLLYPDFTVGIGISPIQPLQMK